MKRFRIIGTFALAAALCFAMFGCASNDYKPELKSATVTSPTIGENGVLRVGVNTAKSPLAGMGNDKIIGIDVDIAAAIADELGLTLSIVDVGTTPANAIEQDKVDIVLGIDSSDSYDDVWLSEEYLPTGVALFALQDSAADVPKAGDDVKIAAQTSSKSAWAITNLYGDSALSSTQDLASAFDELDSGNADFLASDAIIGMYAANRHGVDVKIAALLQSPSGYCVGVAKKNTDLQKAISDSLTKLMTNGTINVIEEKWLGDPLDLQDVPNVGDTKSSSSSSSAASSSSESA